MNSNLQRIVVPVVGLGILGGAWYLWGWKGAAFAITGFVMWALMHLNRMMQVLRRASQQPKGHVDSAVMLNAKLRKGVNLLHVMAMTRSIGDPMSRPDADPELFRWTDDGGSHVTCEFERGKLARWSLYRPEGEAEAPPVTAP